MAFPTETVYGLGADASNSNALERIYRVKGRPRNHPVIVHLRGAEDLGGWAREVPESAQRLAKAFWPGPLTLVLKRAPPVLDAVTGGADTIALRVPAHPLAQALLAAFAQSGASRALGLAAPSANRFGRVSPTTAEHVVADLDAEVDLVLDGGPCEVGIESTIVDLASQAPAILRPGRITAAEIERVLGAPLVAPSAQAPRAPGTLHTHYAPRARVRLASRRQIIDILAAPKGQRIAVLALEVSVPRLAPALAVVVPAIAADYARSLYANLRALDASGADLILVEMPLDTPGWAGVLDRLRRATG